MVANWLWTRFQGPALAGRVALLFLEVGMFVLLIVWLVAAEIPKIAIVDFDSTVSVKDPKQKLSPEDEEELALTKTIMDDLEHELQVEFDIVERRKLETVMKEHKIAKGSQLEKDGAAKVWELLKADYLLTGTITDFVKRKIEYKSQQYNISSQTYTYMLDVSYKLIESNTGKVIVVGRSSIRTDTRQLRSEGLEDAFYQGYLSRALALDVRDKLVKDLRARQD